MVESYPVHLLCSSASTLGLSHGNATGEQRFFSVYELKRACCFVVSVIVPTYTGYCVGPRDVQLSTLQYHEHCSGCYAHSISKCRAYIVVCMPYRCATTQCTSIVACVAAYTMRKCRPRCACEHRCGSGFREHRPITSLPHCRPLNTTVYYYL